MEVLGLDVDVEVVGRRNFCRMSFMMLSVVDVGNPFLRQISRTVLSSVLRC